MIDDRPRMSQNVRQLTQDRSLNAVYGYVVEIFSIDDQDFYIPLIAPEESAFSIDTKTSYIPLEESTESLAASFGEPRNLIGQRVRIEYYGARWQKGTCRIVPPRSREPIGNTMELPSRGFRHAVAGGGGV